MSHVDRSIELCLAPELLRIFFPLFQVGVELDVEVGCSVKQLLVEQFGISSDYLAGRITTLFLNSKAIDDAATAVVGDGAVLALSGAMPGLVGATMRSGGHLAAMRGAMTYANDQQEIRAKQGRIKLKLFNLLLEELSPRLLLRGIILSVTELKSFLAEQPSGFRLRGCKVDGRPVAPDLLQKGQCLEDDDKLVKLRVHFGDE